MSFTPQSYVDQVGPPVTAAWLNGIDQLAYNALQGAQTIPALQAVLGITPGLSTPVDISVGGTGATTAAVALANLGGTTLAAALAAASPSPVATQAEIQVGFTTGTLFTQYPVGNLLRIGLIPNDVTKAAQNTTLMQKYFNPLILNGPTGLFYTPNSGAASPTDVYYFGIGTVLGHAVIQIRDGVGLDFNATTWNFSTTWTGTQTDCGFLMANANVVIQNGNIIANSLAASGVGKASGHAIGLGARDGNSVYTSLFDSIFLATKGYTLGNIVLRNLNISMNNAGSGVIGGGGILCFSGLQNVTIENVWIDGQNTLGYGLYYEFGWATSEASRYQRQNSHAHNWSVRNFKATNMYPSATSQAFAMNGAYNISIDGIHGSNLGQVVSFGTGEASFLNPWVGQDDIGSLAQNGQPPMTGTAAAGRQISLRNVVGRQVRGSAVLMGGNSGTSGWAQSLPRVLAWIPGTVYAAGSLVYNGAYKYSTAAGGTSAAGSPYAGPKGTTPGADGTVTDWVFVAYAAGTGYRGWSSILNYSIGDIVANGQYLYICTTGGTAGGTFQGPTGVGTGLTDGSGGAVRWSSIPSTTGLGPAPLNSAFPAFSDQLNYTLEDFDVDGATFGGTLVNFSGGQVNIRNGKITNAGFGIQQSSDCTSYTIENVSVLNGSSFGMRLGFTPTVWTPTRRSMGTVRNCFIAGNTFGIVTSDVGSLLIENNRFGYEVAHDGIAETTQQYAVFIGVNIIASGVVCRGNWVAGATTLGYFLHDSSQIDCLIDSMVGPIQTYSGPWEGVPQSISVALTCGTPGDLAIAYTTQSLDYIKRGLRVDFTMEIVTSAFTHTTSTGNVQVQNLPFQASNVLGSLPVGALTFQGITKAGYTNFNIEGSGGSSALAVVCSGSAQPIATLAIGDLPTGGTVKLFASGFYFTTT